MARFEYSQSILDSIKLAYPSTGVEDILSHLAKPPSKLYLRVNTLKIDVGEVIDLIKSRGYDIYRDPYIPEAIYFKVLGPYNISDHDKKVIADKYASESILMGANLYAPGVVRCDKDIVEGDYVTIYSETGLKIASGKATRSCMEALRDRRGLFVNVEESIFKAPKIRDLDIWSRGYIYPQSLPSILIGKLVKPLKGWIVVDMCAAPGGKVTHIYQLYRNLVSIYAFDNSKIRIDKMLNNFSRLGVDGIKVFRGDSRYISIDYPWLKADLVILDPPCTDTGVRPKVYDKKTHKDLESLVNYQKQFIHEAYKILKPGGIMIYSTCSLTFHENEKHIINVINEGLFDIIEPPQLARSVASIGKEIPWIRFNPAIHDTPGFFIALLKKK